MKAFIFDGPGCGQIEEMEIRRPAPHEVLLKVEACGICGTDFHIWAGTEPAARHVVLGHEFCGTVLEVGDEISGYHPGNRVTIDPNIACGSCAHCRKGRVNLCSQLRALGIDIDGGFAEYCIVPAAQLYVIPDQMTWQEAAMAEPLACALNGIDRADIRAGYSVMVIGGGPIGLLMLQLARLRGASRLILSEKASWRREAARDFGVDLILDPSYGPLSEQIPEDARPEVVIECVGLPETQEEAVRVVQRGGTVLLFGCGPVGCTFSMDSYEIYARELTVRGAALNPFTHARAVSLIGEKRVDVGSLVTSQIALAELPHVLNSGVSKRDLKVVVCLT